MFRFGAKVRTISIEGTTRPNCGAYAKMKASSNCRTQNKKTLEKDTARRFLFGIKAAIVNYLDPIAFTFSTVAAGAECGGFYRTVGLALCTGHGGELPWSHGLSILPSGPTSMLVSKSPIVCRAGAASAGFAGGTPGRLAQGAQPGGAGGTRGGVPDRRGILVPRPLGTEN